MNEEEVFRLRDAVIQASERWLETNARLFSAKDEGERKRKARLLKSVRKELGRARGAASVSQLLAFALWLQNTLASFFSVVFGMGIGGVKSFHITNPEVDEVSSLELAQSLSDMLAIQFNYPHSTPEGGQVEGSARSKD